MIALDEQMTKQKQSTIFFINQLKKRLTPDLGVTGDGLNIASKTILNFFANNGHFALQKTSKNKAW